MADNEAPENETENEDFQQGPQFPNHEQPRVWFLTAGNSPIAVALTRYLIQHGDIVVACVLRSEYEKHDERREEFQSMLGEFAVDEEARARMKIVGFDIRLLAECQAAIAEALRAFGRIDILFCCNSEDSMLYNSLLNDISALIGTIEELSQTSRTQSLITDQFATNFFGPVNIIKSVLPSFRILKAGHIILLTGITGHIGTPGLGMYCASQWAIEGYCDSLAYEVAPFNVKVSIVQSNLEVSVLTNKITAVPAMPAYSPPSNNAPLSRYVLGRVLDQLHDAESTAAEAHAATYEGDEEEKPRPSALFAGEKIESIFPALPAEFRDTLVAETVHAILAIGGHENPPARHIVGIEGVAAVKEKLKTVSEELEDFVEVSGAVDL